VSSRETGGERSSKYGEVWRIHFERKGNFETVSVFGEFPHPQKKEGLIIFLKCSRNSGY